MLQVVTFSIAFVSVLIMFGGMVCFMFIFLPALERNGAFTMSPKKYLPALSAAMKEADEQIPEMKLGRMSEKLLQVGTFGLISAALLGLLTLLVGGN